VIFACYVGNLTQKMRLMTMIRISALLMSRRKKTVVPDLNVVNSADTVPPYASISMWESQRKVSPVRNNLIQHIIMDDPKMSDQYLNSSIFHTAVDTIDRSEPSIHLMLKIIGQLTDTIDEQNKKMTELISKGEVRIMTLIEKDEVKLCPKCGELMDSALGYCICNYCGNVDCKDLDTYQSAHVPNSEKKVHKLLK
jgi:hypothetical protein